MLKCVVIDDQLDSIEIVKNYISLIPELDLVNTYTDPEAGLYDLLHLYHQVDILFLDIRMPKLSGIELAGVVRKKIDKIIFTTSYRDHAFDAYDAGGDAYLLKPFSFSKFTNTVQRLFTREFANYRVLTEHGNEYFMVKSKEDDLRILKVFFCDVIAFESCHNHLKIHLNNNRVILAYLALTDILPLVKNKNEFQQFHRAFIISTDYIEFIEGHAITLNNRVTFNIGENFKASFTRFIAEKLIKTNRRK